MKKSTEINEFLCEDGHYCTHPGELTHCLWNFCGKPMKWKCSKRYTIMPNRVQIGVTAHPDIDQSGVMVCRYAPRDVEDWIDLQPTKPNES